MNSKNLVPIKLCCSWNRQMSVLGLNCLEMNRCKPGTKPDIIYKYCKIMAKDWHEKSSTLYFIQSLPTLLRMDGQYLEFERHEEVQVPEDSQTQNNSINKK